MPKGCLLALVCAWAATARAQSDAGYTLDAIPEITAVDDRASFHEAVERALKQSPTAGIAAAELRRAAALVEQARATALPQVFVQGEYVRLGPNSLANAAGSGLSSGASGQTLVALDNWLVQGQVNVPVIAPTAWATWAHALNDETAAQWTEKEARRQIALGAAHAYLSVIAQKRIVESNRLASDTDRAHYEYTEKRHLGGMGTPLDEMRARQQYESDRASLVSALLGLERAQEALGVMLGENHPVDTVEDPQLETPTDLARGLDDARTLRPDVQQAEARLRAARQVDRDKWLDFMPSFIASFEPTLQTPPLAPNLPLTWEFLLTLNWTIYDGGLRYGQHKEHTERLLEADLTLQGSILQTNSDIRIGFKALQRTEEALSAARAAAAAAHQAVDVANQQYKAGSITNIDVVDAERRSHDADTTVAVAEDSARQARLDLLGSLGRFP